MDKLADYDRNPSYERRIVAFYDMLGWRSEIADAGTDPNKVGNLRRLILTHTRVLGMSVNSRVNVSTFSDNVVISASISDHNIAQFLREVAVMQLLTATLKFLLRGGIVLGDVYHDNEAVFGPALNRAYDLERCVAKFPRVVLDEEVVLGAGSPDFVAVEDGVYFLDPFTSQFVQFWLDNSSDRNLSGKAFADSGLPSSGRLPPVPGYLGLQAVLDDLKPRLRSPLEDKDYTKIAWLFDRIANRLGQPPSSSYPRARPENY